MAKKINITISEELAERLEEYCKKNYLTKSGVITMATTDYLNTREMQISYKNMTDSIAKLAEIGLIDKDKLDAAITLGTLKDFACSDYEHQGR